MRYNLYLNNSTESQIVFSSNILSEVLKVKKELENENINKEYQICEAKILINFNDIRISNCFRKSCPRANKMNYYQEMYALNPQKLIENNPIVVTTTDSSLIDGYCTYLILKENGYIGNISVSLWGTDSRYRIVSAIHKDNPKIYQWYITSGKYRNIQGVQPGDKVKVKTRYGKQVVTVVAVDVVSENDMRLKKMRKVVGKVRGDKNDKR